MNSLPMMTLATSHNVVIPCPHCCLYETIFDHRFYFSSNLRVISKRHFCLFVFNIQVLRRFLLVWRYRYIFISFLAGRGYNYISLETCSRSLDGLGREQTSTQRETLREHWKRPRVVDLRATKRGLYPLQLLIHYRIAGDAATLPGTLGRFLPTSVPSLGHALCPLTPLPTPHECLAHFPTAPPTFP